MTASGELPPIRPMLTFWERLRGMIGRGREPEAYLFPHTNMVHTCFMGYPIDVAFLAKDGTVLRVVTLRPWRLSPYVRGTAHILEAPAGALSALRSHGRLPTELLSARARPSSRQGQALIEFVLILPVLVLLTLGGIALFLMVSAANATYQAASAGALAVANGASPNDVNTVICQDLGSAISVDAAQATYTVAFDQNGQGNGGGSGSCGCGNNGNVNCYNGPDGNAQTVTVTVTLPYTPVMPLPGVSSPVLLQRSFTASLGAPGNGQGQGNGRGRGQGQDNNPGQGQGQQ
jgi:Flp pilus assembly protein TadG